MNKRTYMWLWVLLATLVLVSPALSGCTTSSGSVAPVPNAAVSPMTDSSVASAAMESAAPGTPQEGIKVHGHWTIEVKNPDGTLAERREFDNSLTSIGGQTLSRVMGRLDSVGMWQIQLFGHSTAEYAFMNASSNPTPGFIVESSYPGNSPNTFKTLTVTVPTSETNVDKLVLSGTATAQRDGNINSVLTYVSKLSASTPPSSTYISGTAVEFTHTVLPTAVNLITGQQVMVTVVINFS